MGTSAAEYGGNICTQSAPGGKVPLPQHTSIRSILLGALIFLTGVPLSAGPLGTIAGGKPQSPLPGLQTGLTFSGLVHDPGDRVFVLSFDFVFELSQNELVRIAGCGLPGFAGDGSSALDAQFFKPSSLAVDASGNIYVGDTGNFRVRKINLATGSISTVAGNGVQGLPLEGKPATDSPLGFISAITADAAGNLWIADTTNYQIHLVAAASGFITKVAGTGTPGFDGDDVPALTSRIGIVAGLATDNSSNLWIADNSNLRILFLDAGTGLLRTVAGGGDVPGIAADAGDALNAAIRPTAVDVDAQGNIFLADSHCSSGNPPCPGGVPESDLIRIVDVSNGLIKTLAGGGFPPDGIGDGLSPREALLARVPAISLPSDRSLLFIDGLNRRVRDMDSNFSLVQTVAGNGAERFGGDGGPSHEALLARPGDVQVAPGGGRLWITDTGNNRIRLATKVDGLIVTAAGGGSPPDGIGDGLLATDAALNAPRGVATDIASNLWIADTGNGLVRVVDAATKIIQTVAGVPATSFPLITPVDVAVTPFGEFFISDAGDGTVHFVDAGGGISLYAGGGVDASDGIPATTAFLSVPGALALDAADNLYIAEEGASRVRVVDAFTGIIKTVAGQPSDPVPLVRPQGLAVDTAGNLWIGDSGAHHVFRVDLLTGVLTPAVGTGAQGASPDGTPADQAELNAPAGVGFDVTGELIFAETGNQRVRIEIGSGPSFSINPSSGSLNGGFPAQINGLGFLDGLTTVTFDGTPAQNVVVVDDATVTADVPTGTSPASNVNVLVETVGGLASIPGGFTYVNDLPTAVPHPTDPIAGYLVASGGSLALDGSASSDPNEIAGDSISSYEWDLDEDGIFDVFGPTPVVTPAELTAFGLLFPGVYKISLRVTDEEGAESIASTDATLLFADVSSTSGSINGGYPGQISGLGLAGVTDVLYGSSAVAGLTVTDGLLTFTVPSNPVPGPVDVTLVFSGQNAGMGPAFTYTNDPPVALASPSPDGYSIRLNDTLVLDGTGSSDPNGVVGDAIVLYDWDVNNDGAFDRRGPKVKLTPGELAGLSIVTAGTRSVVLRVTDSHGATDTDTAVLVVKDVATTFPNEDFTEWTGDQDQNKIDDEIDALPDGTKVDIVLVLGAGADLDATAARLAPLSEVPPAKIPAISALCLKGVLKEDVRDTIGGEPDLFRTEAEKEIEPDLDVSSPAIRAGPSLEFTPDTAHDRSIRGAGVNIAVLDSGVDDDHPALAGKFVAGFDAFVDAPLPLGSKSNPDDDFQFAGIFHGTHVAGIAMGDHPTFPGVAPDAKLIDVKILDALGRGTTASVLVGLQWCIDHKDFMWPGQPAANHGIDIVNLSVSSRLRSDGKDSLSMMVDVVVQQGIVVVCSAGNSSSLGSGFGAPGAADRAITVAALDDLGTVDRADDIRRGVSNFGPRLDDGDSDLIEELKPDVTAPGAAIESPNGNAFAQPASGFTGLIGSSAASAHVAGVAALILENDEGADPATVKTLLRNTAEPRFAPFDLFLDPTYNEFFGKGIVNAFSSLPKDLGNANVVWVSRNGDDQVIAVVPDPSPTPSSSLKVGSPYPIGGGREPYGIGVDSKGNVWLANQLNASVTKLNSAGQVRFAVGLGLFGASGGDVEGIAVDGNDDAWLTLKTLDRVVRVFADGSLDPTSYAVGTSPVDVAIDRFTNIWVANSGSGNVTKLNSLGVEAFGSPFAVGTTPSAIVCDRGGRAYIANLGSHDVTILEQSGSLVGNFPAGLKPVEITIDFAGNIWVSNDNEASLTRLDPDGLNPLTVAIGPGPRGISVAGDGTLFASIYTAGIGALVDRVQPDGTFLETIVIGQQPINHGDGTGFVHANSVDPDGDADGDGWTNAEEIDAFTNPFDRVEHPLSVTLLTPGQGSVSGGTPVTIDGTGLELPVTVEFDGAPATVVGATPDAIDVLAPAGTFPPGGPVDVVVRRPEGSSGTLAASYQYLNDDPIADPDPDNPNDSYVVFIGNSLDLDGLSSSDPNEPVGDSIVSFDWDVNGNAVSGSTPSIPAATLTTFGMGGPGVYPLTLTVTDSQGAQGVAATTVRIPDPSDPRYLRSDSNQDAATDLADPIHTLDWLFRGAPQPPCLEAANSNGDNQVDLADVIYSLNYQFRGLTPPPFPFPACNPAPAPLGCFLSACP